MRFYDLSTKAVTAEAGYFYLPSGVTPAGNRTTVGRTKQWTSFPNGQYDQDALDVTFDFQLAPANTPGGASVITVHGVSLDDLRQAVNFVNSEVSFHIGMIGGLPLSANQPQPGLLVRASVIGAFGNWQGTEQRLDLLLNPSMYTHANPGNIVFNWQPGQSFADAITKTLNVAWPRSTVITQINGALTTTEPQLHVSRTAAGFAHFIKDLTTAHSTLGPTYPGVSIYFNGSQIFVVDQSGATGPTTALKFTDLIGQPVWLEPPTLTINVIARTDILIGSYITMPVDDVAGPGLVLTPPTIAASQYGRKLSFSGKLFVTGLRATGRFRGTEDTSWVTVIQAVPVAA